MADQNKDNLSGSLKQRRLDEDIDAEIARAKRYMKALSLLMIDINWFKNYKDYHGEAKSDLLIKKIFDLLKGNVRNIDTVYRYEEDALAVLLPETDKVQALSTAKRVQKILGQKLFAKDNHSKEKTIVSIGIASYPWDSNSREELLKSSVLALKAAKDSGRNSVCFFDFDIENYICDSQSTGKIRYA